ncbi:MAG TPA: hypothetical protein VE567_02475 [Sphingomonas sp.]|nr:hypothetical protein [Sphingomonas sp.]
MKLRPSLLLLTAAAAGASVLANSVSAADPTPAVPQTRLGASIAQDLSQQDREVARRRRALELREQAAQAAEQRLQANLQGPPAAAGARPGAPADPNEDRYADLARIYQAMRPNRAAAVFEQLEMGVQVEVARRMRERSTALILASMSAQGAAALTMAMARMPQSQMAVTPQPGQMRTR